MFLGHGHSHLVSEFQIPFEVKESCVLFLFACLVGFGIFVCF